MCKPLNVCDVIIRIQIEMINYLYRSLEGLVYATYLSLKVQKCLLSFRQKVLKISVFISIKIQLSTKLLPMNILCAKV